MLCHPAKPLPQGQMGDQTKDSNTVTPVRATGPGHMHEHAEVYSATHTCLGGLTSSGAEEDFILQPLFTISLPHYEATGPPFPSFLSIYSPLALHISNRAGCSV